MGGAEACGEVVEGWLGDANEYARYERDREGDGVLLLLRFISLPCLAQEPARLEDYDGDDEVGREPVLRVEVFACSPS